MTIEAPSLLITDDDAAFRETLQGVLEPQGYRTFLGGGWRGGPQDHPSRGDPPPLLDMHMPKLTGLETLRQVKLFKAMLPCIILSADLDEALIEQARRADAFSVLPKRFPAA